MIEGSFRHQSTAGVSIRPILKGDLPSIGRFRARLSHLDRKFFHFLNRRNLDDLLDPGNFFGVFVAREGKAIVGYAHLQRFTDQSKSHVGRLGIAVDPKHRGRGIGKALMRRVLEVAEAKKLRKVWLSVHAHNHSAIRLYELFGFQTEGLFVQEEKWGRRFVDIAAMALFVGHRD